MIINIHSMHLHNESRRGSPEYVSKFGFHIPTHCGQLQQGNKWEDDWPVRMTNRTLGRVLDAWVRITDMFL